MSSLASIRYVAATKKSPLASLLLQCHVKPGASKSREGVLDLTDEKVEIAVAAQAKDGEANKAVIAVLSKALDMPKSDITITRGLTSRDKTVVVNGTLAQGTEEEAISRVRSLLTSATEEEDS